MVNDAHDGRRVRSGSWAAIDNLVTARYGRHPGDAGNGSMERLVHDSREMTPTPEPGVVGA
jgi:hypothetical protein